MIQTTPTVRLIAETRIIDSGLRPALVEQGGDSWFQRVRMDNESPDAEDLVEYAGRRCYRSWEPGLNPNVTKVREDSSEYLSNILRSGHGSVLEHVSFTFDFQNVSRVATHELVRHRAGVAISQESLRYVRLTDIGLRIPEVLENGPDLGHGPERQTMRDAIVEIVERLEDFQVDAAEAFGLDDPGVPFHVKKEVTSALRRLAPIGVSTGMVWTANARTLRHVIAMRTDPSAEEEIRLMFDRVARVVTRRYPNLFGDFEQVHDRDCPVYDDADCACISSWVPEFEKV